MRLMSSPPSACGCQPQCHSWPLRKNTLPSSPPQDELYDVVGTRGSAVSVQPNIGLTGEDRRGRRQVETIVGKLLPPLLCRVAEGLFGLPTDEDLQGVRLGSPNDAVGGFEEGMERAES